MMLHKYLKLQTTPAIGTFFGIISLLLITFNTHNLEVVQTIRTTLGPRNYMVHSQHNPITTIIFTIQRQMRRDPHLRPFPVVLDLHLKQSAFKPARNTLKSLFFEKEVSTGIYPNTILLIEAIKLNYFLSTYKTPT
jgi:hypothetical protein